jgi:Uma2 family endonuclease
MSRSFICMGMCSFPISPAGVASGCPLCQASAFELAPDWVCEVLSPSTASFDRTEKLPVYAREQVAHVWLVDPLLQMLEVFRLDGAGYRLAGAWRGDAVVRCEPFESLAISLADLWSA